MKRLALSALFVFVAAAQSQKGAKSLFIDHTSGNVVSPNAPNKSGGQRPVSNPLPPPPIPEDGAVTGVRYWIELLTEQNQLLRVNASRIFKSGERIRLHFESNVDGRLVILQSQNGAPYATLFPNSANAAGRVQKFMDQTFPSANGWFRFDNKPGDIRLLVTIHADSRSQDLPLLAQATPSGVLSPEENKQIDAFMRKESARNKGSKALFVEEDNSPDAPSTYVVVDSRKSPNVTKGVVAVEVRLSHK